MYVYACIIYLTNDDRSCSDTRIYCKHYAESDFNLRIHMALLRIHKALLRIHRALWHSVTNDDIMQIQGYVAEIRARALFVCAYLTWRRCRCGQTSIIYTYERHDTFIHTTDMPHLWATRHIHIRRGCVYTYERHDTFIPVVMPHIWATWHTHTIVMPHCHTYEQHDTFILWSYNTFECHDTFTFVFQFTWHIRIRHKDIHTRHGISLSY